jgi:urease accessory protein
LPVRGRLELRFAIHAGRTVLTHLRAAAPLKVVRPFRLDDGSALVQVLMLGPGFCGGDACDIDISVERGARAIVVSQSASRILGMKVGLDATQTVTLRAAAASHLEYYPGLTIPFPASSFIQRVDVHAAESARVGIVEGWAMGRRGCNEYLQFRLLRSRTTVDVDGSPVYADAIELDPSTGNLAATGILEGCRYVASGFWYGATPPTDVGADTLAVVGRSAENQVYLRALAPDGYRLVEVIHAAIRRIRAEWGLEPIPIRRFTA